MIVLAHMCERLQSLEFAGFRPDKQFANEMVRHIMKAIDFLSFIVNTYKFLMKPQTMKVSSVKSGL